VNYRGSSGYGTADLNSLLGKIGTQDVDDCVLLTQHVLNGASQNLKENGENIPSMNRERVAVVGASHGGFLGAHLSAQYPDIYKVRLMPIQASAYQCVPEKMIVEVSKSTYAYPNFLQRGNFATTVCFSDKQKVYRQLVMPFVCLFACLFEFSPRYCRGFKCTFINRLQLFAAPP